MEKFRELKVWQKANGLVLLTYQITKNFPREELFCLVSQMRRAAISVMANIVEGTKRKTVADRTHFNVMADTSLEELKCYYILSFQLDYISEEMGKTAMSLAREVGAMLNAFSKSINKM